MNNGELSSVGDLELQLTTCNRIVSLLCNRLSTGHFQLVQLLNNLNRCGYSLSVTLSTLSQLNPHPSISDICSNVTSTHGQLKHIQSLLLSHEHDASDNLKIIYAFQQKLEERIKQCKIKARSSLKTAKHNAVQTDFISNNEQFNQQTFSNPKPNGFKNPGEIRYETLLKYGLVNPRNVLNRTLKHSSFSESDEPTKCELQEALLNALGQVDRLKKYRINQKTRIDQLQKRLDHMGTELDSSVDAIRHHQKNYEAQKHKAYMEITHLRNQLAKTTASLEQFKLSFSKTNLNTCSLDQNMRGNDITSSGEILVDESLKYGSANEPRILSEIQFNNLHVSNKSTPVSLMGNNNEAVINSYQNSMLHSISELKHDNFINLNQSVSEDSLHSQLLQRIKRAEEEAIMATDQLKASNAEFLTLKEHLSHATVERAHLKATIERLDEQVALLENSLYERTQELHKCQILLVKYCPTYQKPVTPYSVGPEVPTSELSIKIHEPNNNYTSEPAVFNVRGLLQSFEPKESFLRSPSIKFKFLHQLVNHKDWLSVLLKLLVVRSQQLTSRISSGIKHTSFRLQSQPRPKPIFIFLIYFFSVHLMLLHCWLL